MEKNNNSLSKQCLSFYLPLKPTQYTSRILRDQNERFVAHFQHFHQSDDYTKFKLNFRNAVKKLCGIWGKVFRKEKSILTRFSSVNWNKTKGKQNHNSLLDSQTCYKSATLKSTLSLLLNPNNKYKSQCQKIVACAST